MKRNMCVQIMIKLLFYSQIETRQKNKCKVYCKVAFAHRGLAHDGLWSYEVFV
jgi:hypothetical protein